MNIGKQQIADMLRLSYALKERGHDEAAAYIGERWKGYVEGGFNNSIDDFLPHADLQSTFVWRDTPQGVEYWDSLNNELTNTGYKY